jgi:hypothetical protein
MADGQQQSVQSATRHAIVQILGAVRTDAELKGRPADNNTRWVFDVESMHKGGSGQDAIADANAQELVFFLLDPRNEKLVFQPDIFSCSLTPLCEEYHSARPYIEYRESDGAFVLHARRVPGIVRYRVGIDTIHSATR